MTDTFPKELLKIDPYQLAYDTVMSSKIANVEELKAHVRQELTPYVKPDRLTWWYQAGEGFFAGVRDRKLK